MLMRRFSWLQIDSGGKYENISETNMFLDLGTADGADQYLDFAV